MNKFYLDRDTRGRVAEYLLLELLHSRGIPAELNPAPEDDYEGRAAYDISVLDEWWEVKLDSMSWATGRICIERPTLEHTQAQRFAFFLPTPSGYYIHCFTPRELIDLYNSYSKKLVGDQQISAVVVSKDITKTVGLPLWQVTKQLRQQQAA